MLCKKYAIGAVCIVGLIALFLCACSSEGSESKLSEMGDNELIQYIVDSGVSIPENIEVKSIREMIIELEENPDHPSPALGWTVITDLYEDLRNVVKTYYSTGM